MESLISSNGVDLCSYNGDRDPDEFFRRFRIHSTLLNIDEERQLQLISDLLCGRAKMVFDDMEGERTMQLVEQTICNSFRKSAEHYLREFSQRKPQPNETLAAYAAALKRLAQLAMPTLPQAQRAQLLTSCFMANIPTHIATSLRLSGARTWQQINDWPLLKSEF